MGKRERTWELEREAERHLREVKLLGSDEKIKLKLRSGKQKTARLTEEPITPEEWERVLGIHWESNARSFLEELRENGPLCPKDFGIDWTTLETIKRALRRNRLPFRLYMERSVCWQEEPVMLYKEEVQ